jgi:hypothetical protein
MRDHRTNGGQAAFRALPYIKGDKNGCQLAVQEVGETHVGSELHWGQATILLSDPLIDYVWKWTEEGGLLPDQNGNQAIWRRGQSSREALQGDRSWQEKRRWGGHWREVGAKSENHFKELLSQEGSCTVGPQLSLTCARSREVKTCTEVILELETGVKAKLLRNVPDATKPHLLRAYSGKHQ